MQTQQAISSAPTSPARNVIDVRGMSYAVAQPLVYAATTRLAVGQHVQVLADTDPSAMMRAVAFQLRDAISWRFETDGKLWRIDVQPRAEAEAKDVVDLLTWDHYRLDRLFADVLAAANENRIVDAEAIFKDYWIGLRRHVHLENNVLGPTLGGGAEKGPLADMLFEHDSIIVQSRLLEETLLEKDYGILPALCAVLSGSLAKHENREETTLFPIWQTTDNSDRGRAAEFLARAKELLAGAEDQQVDKTFS
ncbi:hemerythrin domain-containing protein [Acidithiobacillus sp.]|uniref:hemerythrin domain-containing protein n=1 Tax=Acidithiobacillus sp. TaxID=1872118 RepID=UPI0025BE79B0|nr:hemerythrin domain-containing protein [Acidithiobacillus sp.]MCK9187691.1 hemerythrin domain-containing protein [Acidithiobacillus sp.]MCK9358581.1 hemerythrin domain-containing protein [Acidithiobacillus sp.]